MTLTDLNKLVDALNRIAPVRGAFEVHFHTSSGEIFDSVSAFEAFIFDERGEPTSIFDESGEPTRVNIHLNDNEGWNE